MNPDTDFSDYYKAKFDIKIITAISTILVGYGFQQNFFPTYHSLKHKSDKRIIGSVYGAVFLSMFLYTTVSFISIYMFGSSVSKGNILANVAEEKGEWVSYALRAAFLIVIGCHIPFLFFSGKESLLTIVDEIQRKSFSKLLEIQVYGKRQEGHTEGKDVTNIK